MEINCFVCSKLKEQYNNLRGLYIFIEVHQISIEKEK